MRLEEAIVYVLSTAGYGMRTERIAEEIKSRRLHVRRDGNPVTSVQVCAVICRYPDTFVKSEGRIRLIF